MPDVDGKLLLDADGRELLRDDGREACECCVCECPEGLATSYLVAGHFDNSDIGCSNDFSGTAGASEEVPCYYSGFDEIDCDVYPEIFFNVVRAGPAQGYEVCGFAVQFPDQAVETFKAGDDPTGSYPDIFSGTISITGIVVT